MQQRQQTRGARRALLAALLLVVQAFATAFALGAGASAAPLDAFGNPICATAADYGHHPGTGGGHANLPECCVSGCPMAAAGPGAPPDAASLLLPADERVRSIRTFIPAHLATPARLGLPGSPRAPPAGA